MIICPVANVVVEIPDRIRAAEMMSPATILRMLFSLSFHYYSFILYDFDSERFTGSTELVMLFPALSPCAAGELPRGKGRRRNTNHDEADRQYECDDYFAHVSLP